MINTAPMGKMPGMGQPVKAQPMARKSMGGGRGAVAGAMRKKPMGGGFAKTGGSGLPVRNNTMRAPNYSGPYGKIPSVGGPSDMGGGGPMGMSPGGPMRTQADGLMAAEQGPVAQSAPPMFMPPNGMNEMNPGMQPEMGGSMLMDQYVGQNRDPRFRY